MEAEASDDWRPDDSEAEEEEDSEELEDSDASAEAGSSANDEDADEEIDEPSREKKPKVANPSTSKTRASSGIFCHFLQLFNKWKDYFALSLFRE